MIEQSVYRDIRMACNITMCDGNKKDCYRYVDLQPGGAKKARLVVTFFALLAKTRNANIFGR